jgi:MoaA/NifB/PqqE/SkfB family radical SAM enzyme
MTFISTILARAGQKRPVADPARPPPAHYGYVERRSAHHVEGWVHNAADPSERPDLLLRYRGTDQIIARGRADHYHYGLPHVGCGDGGYGFFIRLPHPLSPDLQNLIEVVPERGGRALPSAPGLTTQYEPLMLLSMDIVDNCNLRCPFCLFDHSATRATHMMQDDTIDAALRFLPYVTDGNFWFSCLHEPSLHPHFTRFLDKVPAEWRRKLFFTTNLAKRMPPSYFDFLAGSRLHHINISVDSLVPKTYERLRQGARFAIFMENWDRLMDAMARHAQPVPIRYIAMAYQSNLRELPSLVRTLLRDRRASQVEIRYTFDFPHIPPQFRAAEFLDEPDWLWLRDQLAGYASQDVMLVLPPDIVPDRPALGIDMTERFRAGAPDVRYFLPGRYTSRLSWDGSLEINRFWAYPYGCGPRRSPFLTVNVRDIADPVAFLTALPD